MPVSPVISTVPARRRRAADQLLHLRHRLAVADQRVERTVGADLPLQQVDLPRELPPFGGRADAHQQLVAEERLLHEVDGAELHRFDRRVDGAEAGHHDERASRRADRASRWSTSSPEMPGIRMSDRMTSKALPLAAITPSSPVAAVSTVIAGAAQHARHAVANALVVVDHQNAGHEAKCMTEKGR